MISRRQFLGIFPALIAARYVGATHTDNSCIGHSHIGFCETDAEAAVITCIDFRFLHFTEGILRQRYGDKFDLLSLPGGGANFSFQTHQSEQKVIKEGTLLSIEAHHIEEIRIFSHRNCGMVWQAGKRFSSPEQERNFHHNALRKAGNIIQRYITTRSHAHPKIFLGFLNVNENNLPFVEEVALAL